MKKKTIGLVLCSLFMVLLFTACSSSTTVTYEVETGDSISLKLDTTNGYSQNGENPFGISLKDEKIVDGIFTKLESAEIYFENAKAVGNTIEEGTKDGNEYIMYSVEGVTERECNCVVKIGGTNTGIIMTSKLSDEDAKKVYSAITFIAE